MPVGRLPWPKRLPFRRRMARSAVALIHRCDADGEREMLFIERAHRPGDPWSGDMGFPGGRMHAEDPDPRSTAERETREETGLDLAHQGRFERRLSDRLTRQHHRPRPMVVTPYVYEWLGGEQTSLNHEVRSVVWIPWSYLAAPENQSVLHWRTRLGTFRLPCCRYQDYCVWGLSYSMLREYLREGGPGFDDRG